MAWGQVAWSWKEECPRERDRDLTRAEKRPAWRGACVCCLRRQEPTWTLEGHICVQLFPGLHMYPRSCQSARQAKAGGRGGGHVRHLSVQSGFIRIHLDGVLVVYNYKVGHLYWLYLSNRSYLPPPPLTFRYLNICKPISFVNSKALRDSILKRTQKC